ncbi:MAG TPA: ATP-binding protein [Streptosporangiaceae bacterium]
MAFVGVALAAIIVNALVGAETLRADIALVASRQEAALVRATALTAAAAQRGTGWAHADLSPVFELAGSEGAGVQVQDMAGRVIGSSPSFASMQDSGQRRLAVIDGRSRVGEVLVRFGPHGLGALAGSFEAEQWRSRLIAAAIAAAIALVVSLVAARLITAPLELMLSAMRARGAGDRSARIENMRGVGVQRELLEGFNQAADALDERDRLQRNLVADVAHEVRTPVAILQAGHEAMLDGVMEPTPENLASLRDEVLRLARMIEDLQRLAAAEASALQMRRSRHDLAAIAAAAAGDLGESFGTAGVRLELRLTEVPVLCDEDRMREVITNLLANALKFTPAGGNVTLETGPEDGHLALLRVSDDGIGIPADELPRVTERFFRGQRAQEMAGGSGIGLTIVAELVRAHHGQIEFASEPAKGTSVTVTLPMAS